ncbi:MAG: lipid A biosynthesis lauroyl acyltransferase, partial [Succinivibrio sp.]|nr:lipid A biosynthesis lauroyl acyltransferase [Succinivibrio sp.]
MAKFSLHKSFTEQLKEHQQNKRISTVKSGWGKGFVDKPIFIKKMLLPHFWASWCLIFLFYCLVTFLPYRVQMFIGKKIGRLLGSISPARKYVLKRNLELAFPELNETERRKLSIAIQQNSGQAVFETGIAWFWPDWRLKRHIKYEKKQIDEAIAL